MGRSEVQQSAEKFLEQLQQEAKFLSYGEIGSISDTLAQATSILRQAHNERCLLFTLPVEILHKILEFVPDPYRKRWKDFSPLWRSALDLMDSSMLIPVIHTSHRLREIALAHPHLWTTFQAPLKSLKLHLIRQMAEWSKPVPLKAVGSDIRMLEELPPTRLMSIHLYDIDYHGFRCLQTLLKQWYFPTLESFSLFIDDDWDPENDMLSLTPENAPNLRELTLEDTQVLVGRGFPNLTCLALIDISMRNFHARFISFIGECPRLESILLSGLILNTGEEEVPNNLFSSSPLRVPLQHLRHVTLNRLFLNDLEYYVPLLQPRVQGSSFHVLHVLSYSAENLTFHSSFLLSPHPDGPEPPAQRQICIGVHPTPLMDPDYAISLTTITPRSTRRIAAWDSELYNENDALSEEWPSLVLSQCSTSSSSLAADEVWFYGVEARKFSKPPLAHFFGATRVVLALDRRLHYPDDPSLHLLPSTRDPSFAPTSITSVCIVHGFSTAHGESASFSDEPPAESDPGSDSDSKADAHGSRVKLSLRDLIHDLRYEGYEYIKHFVLQVTPQMHVDETELAEVKEAGRFETFVFERIEEFPEMPGHEDPARWGCRRYPGSLW